MSSLLVCGAFQAHSDDISEAELLGIFGSEEFISIATGYKQPVSKAPAVASVITAQDIRRIGATDIDEILGTVPGLHVSRNPQGYNPIYTFRGIYSGYNPQVLMLVNGIPLTNLFTGNRSNAWVGMPVEAINRIEIIRGPGSAVYGADAFAGVINIITEGGDTITENELMARYGSHNTRELSAKFRKKWEHSHVGFILEGKTTDGQNETIAADLQSYLDGIAGTSASLAPGAVNLGRETLDARLDYRYKNFVFRGGYQGRYNAQSGAGVAQALDPHAEFASERINFDLTYSIPSLFTDSLSAVVSASFLDVTQEVDENALIFPPGSTGSFFDENGQPLFGLFPDGVVGSPEIYERHSRFNAAFHYVGLNDHDLTFGAGYYYGDLYRVKEKKNYCTDEDSCDFILPAGGIVDVSDTPFVFLQEGDRKNHYFYIQDVYTLANDWQLTAGLRYDEYSDFGHTLNPRLALVWSTSRNLTTKFLYGEAFRAPAFAETRAINNPTALGNPNLKAETLRSYELIFDYKVNYDLDFIFNTFYYEWEDIIQFVPEADGGTSTAQNAGKQTGYGIELESKWSVTPSLAFSANFAWQESTNKATDSDVANAPGKKIYVQSHWEFMPNTSLNLQANWVMDRKREISDTRSRVDDYILVDLTLRRKNLWGNLEAAILIKNLFDEDAREPTPNGFPVPAIPDDLPLAGRSLFGEIRYQF